MSKPVRVAVWMVFGLGVLCQGAQPRTELEVRAPGPDGLIEYDEGTGIAKGSEGVVVHYGDAELTARQVRFRRDTSEVLAEGTVRIQRGRALWTGEHIRYNFATDQVEADEFRAGLAPFFATGKGLRGSLTNQTHTATNAVVTTDDVAEPLYRVTARELKFIPGQLFEARRATLYLGKVPVMYLPVYRRHFNRHPNNFAFLPGYRSLYGPYVLGLYNWYASTNLEGTIHFDYRLKRGVGGGPDVTYDLGAAGAGQVKTYRARDDDPGADPNGQPIPSERHRIGFSHSAVLRSNLLARAVVHWQSDAQFIHDFFEFEYRKDTQPKSFVEVAQLWPNFTLDMLARAQVNDFFQTVERLPDVKLTAVRQQLGISPFYYEGENSLGYFRFRSGDGGGTNYAAWRGDSYHQLVLPQTLFGWLNVTPRIGGRFTHYGEQEGYSSTLSEHDRVVLNTGAELSAKAARVWPGVHSRFWDANGLRHIVEPSVNYAFVPSPNRLPPELPQFDSELRSLRLTPIDFPDYNSVDSIDSQNVLRVGLRNKLQTKRQEGIDNVVNWAVYADWRLRPRAGQSSFSDVFSDLDFKPRSWITVNSETRYDLDAKQWRLASHTATIQPSENWSWKLGHRYLRSDAGFGLGNNLILSSLGYRINENWALRFTHHLEARDGVLEEQYYTLYRDLRSWTTALTLRIRDNRLGRDDVTVAITFSLKAFPRYGLGKDRDEPWLLLGG